MKTLHLTLKKLPFEVMESGEKKFEFRKDSQWIRSRLLTKNGTRKHYDAIKFTNGYGSHRPSFTCKYEGFSFSGVKDFLTYSNGLKVIVNPTDFVIKLGEKIK